MRAEPLPHPPPDHHAPSRRELLAALAAFLGSAMAPAARARRLPPPGDVVEGAAWAEVRALGEGTWAIVSTPLAQRDFTTTCNGGIVAGRERTLLVDAFARPQGATWAAEITARLTGRRPTDVVLTHFHGDHTAGLPGLLAAGDAPQVWTTARTRELVLAAQKQRPGDGDEQRARLLAEATLLDESGVTSIELGGRGVRVVGRAGHTPSDVTVELDEPDVVLAGDLVWNQMFPNYVDAVPSKLAPSVRATARPGATTYVPGHGPLADRAAIDLYLTVLDALDAAAQRAHESGKPVEEAAAGFELPAPARDWVRFSDDYFVRAFRAWYRELDA